MFLSLTLIGEVMKLREVLTMRGLAKTRYERFRHINRKKRIIKEQNNYWSYKHEGELSKGKIHCSCWMCRRKSYDSPKISDLRKSLAMKDEIRSWENGELDFDV